MDFWWILSYQHNVDNFGIIIECDLVWLILWFSLTEFDRVWLNLTTCRTFRNYQKIKINQVIKPDQKPDYNYAFYLCIPRIYNNYLYYIFCTFGQCVIYPPGLFYPLTGGYFTFWFYVSVAKSWVCVSLTHQLQNPPPRIPIIHHLFNHPKIVSNSHTIQ